MVILTIFQLEKKKKMAVCKAKILNSERLKTSKWSFLSKTIHLPKSISRKIWVKTEKVLRLHTVLYVLCKCYVIWKSKRDVFINFCKQFCSFSILPNNRLNIAAFFGVWDNDFLIVKFIFLSLVKMQWA